MPAGCDGICCWCLRCGVLAVSYIKIVFKNILNYKGYSSAMYPWVFLAIREGMYLVFMAISLIDEGILLGKDKMSCGCK